MHLRTISPALSALTLLTLLSGSVALAGGPSDGSEHPVLVELFTSEGCSSCPPADAILSQMNGKRLDSGQLIVGISEHVTYWNQDGWVDPFSQSIFTDRQNDYGARLHVTDVYTPQVVVDGEAQVNGSDAQAIVQAIKATDPSSPVGIHIDSVAPDGKKLSITFSLTGEVPHHGADIYAVIADDQDSSNVLRGENKGKTTSHVSVARSMTRVATLKDAASKTVTVSVPSQPAARHLILFVQQPGPGKVLAIASQPITH